MLEGGPPETISNFNAMSRMAGAVAHDFNNILTGILGNLELLERRAAKLGIAEFADYLKGARSAATRGVDLTARLLAVAGHQPQEPRVFRAGSVIDEMEEPLREMLGHGIRLDISHQATWPVLADLPHFEEALLIMARNAREAMPGGGAARFEDRNTTLDPAAVVGLDMAAGDYVAVTLHDSGSGMTDEVAARAFEPFFTTKSNGAGAGLGLAMLLGFARQSGGHAKIESYQPGRTAITLFLPRATEANP
jgi:signal transduction histidine kinase